MSSSTPAVDALRYGGLYHCPTCNVDITAAYAYKVNRHNQSNRHTDRLRLTQMSCDFLEGFESTAADILTDHDNRLSVEMDHDYPPDITPECALLADICDEEGINIRDERSAAEGEPMAAVAEHLKAAHLEDDLDLGREEAERDECSLWEDYAGVEKNIDEAAETREDHVDEFADGARQKLPSGVNPGSPWYPFTSLVEFLLAVLISLPGCPSDAYLEMILGMLRLLHVEKVPTLASVRRLCAVIVEMTGCSPVESTSVRYNHPYSFCTVSGIVGRQLASPLVRPNMQLYPIDNGGTIGELYHADKWHNDLSMRSPMWRGAVHDFYIDEAARLSERADDVVIIRRFFVRRGVMFVTVRRLIQTNGQWTLDMRMALVDLPATNLKAPCSLVSLDSAIFKVNSHGRRTKLSKKQVQSLAPTHPLRAQAAALAQEGSPPLAVVRVAINLFADDMSGSATKKWNKHESVYMVIANLPFAEQQRRCNIHFVATTKGDTAMDLFHGVVGNIKDKLERGFVAYDALTKQPVLVVGCVFSILGDNPASSAFASHTVGASAKSCCRMCDATRDFSVASDRTAAKNKSASARTQDAVHRARSFLTVGTQRCWQSTKEQMAALLAAARGASPSSASIPAPSDGTKCSYTQPLVEALLTAQPANLCHRLRAMVDSNMLNALFQLNHFDGHRDPPVEVLHTLLLGPVKHWVNAAVQQAKSQLHVLKARIAGANADGFEHPFNARQLVHHVGSLVGRDYKAVIQILPLMTQGLVQEGVTQLFGAIAWLGSVIYTRRIDDMDEFTQQLQQALDYFLASLAAVAPEVLRKRKHHVLLHLVEQVHRLGPAILTATEHFESFNSVVRKVFTQTNRKAPSRDCAAAFSVFQMMHHVASGGYWRAGGKWVCAGNRVRELRSHRVLRMLLGKPVTTTDVGKVGYKVKCDSPLHVDLQALLASVHNIVDRPALASATQHKTMMTASGDRCRLNGFENVKRVGQVKCILQPANKRTIGVVVLNLFDCELTGTDLEWPLLTPTSATIVVSPACLDGPLNVQHDCVYGECTVQELPALWQVTGELTVSNMQTMQHSLTQRFLLNPYCFRTRSLQTSLAPRMTAFGHSASESVPEANFEVILREMRALRSEIAGLQTSVSDARSDIAKLASVVAQLGTNQKTPMKHALRETSAQPLTADAVLQAARLLFKLKAGMTVSNEQLHRTSVRDCKNQIGFWPAVSQVLQEAWTGLRSKTPQEILDARQRQLSKRGAHDEAVVLAAPYEVPVELAELYVVCDYTKNAV
ncbi:hypothetical protein RI367_007071 [Sorochytrium milnesiophthora]